MGILHIGKKIVIDCVYEDAHDFIKEGLALVKLNGKWGCINNSNEIISPFIYDVALDINWFDSKSSLWVFLDGESGYLDKNGNYSMNETITSDDFIEGLYKNVGENGKYGFLDKETGGYVIPCTYEKAEDFSEGLAHVQLHQKGGFIDKTDREIIPFIYDKCETFLERFIFAEGLANVKFNKKWGFIDRKINQIIPVKYGEARKFSEGLANVKLQNKWGYIDNTGKEIIPFIYDDAGNFEEGLATVKINNKWGSIDKTGNEIIPPIYDYPHNFHKGISRVEKNGIAGYIDKKGNQFWEDN